MTAMRVTHVVVETGQGAVILDALHVRIEDGPLMSEVGLDRVLDLHLTPVESDETIDVSDRDLREVQLAAEAAQRIAARIAERRRARSDGT